MLCACASAFHNPPLFSRRERNRYERTSVSLASPKHQRCRRQMFVRYFFPSPFSTDRIFCVFVLLILERSEASRLLFFPSPCIALSHCCFERRKKIDNSYIERCVHALATVRCALNPPFCSVALLFSLLSLSRAFVDSTNGGTTVVVLHTRPTRTVHVPGSSRRRSVRRRRRKDDARGIARAPSIAFFSPV